MLLHFKTYEDNRGCLSFFENYNPIPFKIGQIYLFHDLSEASFNNDFIENDSQTILIALTGECELLLNNRTHNEVFNLNSPSHGIYIPTGSKYKLKNISTTLSLLVITSDQNIRYF